MANMSKKKIIGIVAAAVIAVIIIAVAALLLLRANPSEARETALAQTGGGQIVSESISSEGLWNEYSYVIQNGNVWYEIEVSGFGNVTEMETGTGQRPFDD